MNALNPQAYKMGLEDAKLPAWGELGLPLRVAWGGVEGGVKAVGV